MGFFQSHFNHPTNTMTKGWSQSHTFATKDMVWPLYISLPQLTLVLDVFRISPHSRPSSKLSRWTSWLMVGWWICRPWGRSPHGNTGFTNTPLTSLHMLKLDLDETSWSLKQWSFRADFRMKPLLGPVTTRLLVNSGLRLVTATLENDMVWWNWPSIPWLLKNVSRTGTFEMK